MRNIGARPRKRRWLTALRESRKARKTTKDSQGKIKEGESFQSPLNFVIEFIINHKSYYVFYTKQRSHT